MAAARPRGRPWRLETSHGIAHRPAEPDAARHRVADVHRQLPRTRARAMQGGHRRFVPRAQRPSGRTARRVAHADPVRARRPQGEAPRRSDRPDRGQPDRPSVECAARARRARVRRAQGADLHHEPARAGARDRRRGARLRRHRAARRDQPASRAEGARSRCRRVDPRRGRRRRPRGHDVAVRARRRSPQDLRRPNRAVRLDRERRLDPRRTGDGRRLRVHGHALHRDAGSARDRRLQARDPEREIVGHHLHEPLHGRARQLHPREHREGGPRSGRAAGVRQDQDEFRQRQDEGVEGHLGRRPGRRPDGRPAERGRARRAPEARVRRREGAARHPALTDAAAMTAAAGAHPVGPDKKARAATARAFVFIAPPRRDARFTPRASSA
ncbi:putative Uncharacterized 50.6 kDa protein in the 5'region of gyrA and gyrB [Burkholderia cepacia]|nr:putative Uncharacterized 50.6 kDa protein in the 5'region of gyrA and gyrB [Burkholderia cepacia]